MRRHSPHPAQVEPPADGADEFGREDPTQVELAAACGLDLLVLLLTSCADRGQGWPDRSDSADSLHRRGAIGVGPRRDEPASGGSLTAPAASVRAGQLVAERWRRRKVVAVGAGLYALSGPGQTTGFSVFVNPVTEAFEVSRGPVVVERDAVAVLTDHDVVLVNSHVPRELGVGDEVAVLAVNGDEELREGDPLEP